MTIRYNDSRLKQELIGEACAGCTVCGEVFSTNRNFDAHRKRGECLHPSDVGLVVGGRFGYWMAPPSEYTRNLKRRKLATT